MNQLVFRSFQPEDAPVVPGLFMRALQTVYPDIQGGEWTSDLEHVQDSYIRDGGDFLVAGDGDTVVAEGGLHKINDTTVEMKRLAVSPEAQQAGLGQELVVKLEDRARELGFSRMVLDTTLGQEAARHIYEKNGYQLVDRKDVAHPSGNTFDTFFYEKQLEQPALFPQLAEKAKSVKPGKYEVLEGSGEDVVFRPNGLHLFTTDTSPKELFPGIYSRGWYEDGGGNKRSVISFLYHKEDAEGNLETTERTIILTGVGYGEHRDHLSQPATWYLVGPDIARINPETGEIHQTTPTTESGIQTKNFSVACITDGPLGEPILANLRQ